MTNLGAGSVCANLKLDHSEVQIHWNGQKISTGRNKLGAIIGDNSQIGCNAVLNPGTLMGQGVKSYPCLNISGFIESNCWIKSEAKLLTVYQ